MRQALPFVALIGLLIAAEGTVFWCLTHQACRGHLVSEFVMKVKR